MAEGSDAPATPYSAISTTLLARAQQEVARIQALVENGTLPQSQLEEAKVRLADAQDEVVLSQTLYGQTRLQDMTADQAQSMVDAAQRRVDRQAKVVQERQMLLDNGILARSEFAVFQDELSSRQRVLGLARNRMKLLDDLREMADVEQRLIRNTQSGGGASLQEAMIRYDGNGLFSLDDMPTISREFEKRFHRSLPVSALGQTLVHQSMGLDHRNRVDVALNPDQPDGIWLRQFLESLHVPYLAFRSAVTGAATAPHIHIGTGSTRLRIAQR